LPGISQCVTTGTGQRYDPETETLIPTNGGVFDVAHAFNATDYESGAFESTDSAGPLTTSTDRTRAAPILAFSAKDHGADAMLDCSPTLRADVHADSHANAGVMPAVAFHENQRAELTTSDTVGTLKTQGGKPGQGYPALLSAMQVRRLTPLETERLQGYRDNYTAITYRGKPAADGPRYKSHGNSWAINCIRWIGERIAAVDGIEPSLN
jgi:site-specific DNA-cytosine methylase